MRSLLAPLCPALPARLLLAVLPFAAFLSAQTPPAAVPVVSTVGGQTPLAADAEWDALKNLGRPKPLPAPTTATAEARAAAREQVIAAYVADADQLHAFATKNPEHPSAPEAQRLEALALLQAAQLGDTTQDIRRATLVAAVRRDATLPAAARVAVAAFADNLAVTRQRDLPRPDRLRAFATVARALTAEFPTEPDGPAALIQLARASDNAPAAALAAELLARSDLPPALRTEAKFLAGRHALPGQSLRPMAQEVFGKEHPLAQPTGGPVILYAWLSASRASVALAQKLATLAPPGALLVGACLDSGDLTAARALAVSAQLPGLQIFDPLGRRGNFAETFKLVDPGLVYVADATGLIRTVSAQRDLPAALALLNPTKGN